MYWVKNIKDDLMFFNMQIIKYAVFYLFFNRYFTVGLKISFQIISIPTGSDPAPFFANIFIYFYESK